MPPGAEVVVPAAAAIGCFTGLLANGGGFLLVPLFVLVLGLTMTESAGTSLVVIAVLSVPTLLTHWALGHIDWTVSGAFAVGAIPGALAGSRLVADWTPTASGTWISDELALASSEQETIDAVRRMVAETSPARTGST